MEPVSDRLRQTLLDLRLCRRSDLRRCRRRVRRLADDLPAFDSVWIDALLQARRLTPFQARLLESGRAADLAVGPCVLLDRLGQGRFAATYLARVRDGRERCVLKLIEPPIEALAGTLDNLKQLAERLQGPPHPHIVGPHAALRHGDRLVSVSRYVDGLRLSELLIRRGRFAPDIVLTIARQLVDGLAWLEERAIVHGDVWLPNVRLTASGRAVLVDAGVAPAVSPQLTIHAGLAPDRYDGVAPERIGTGQEPTIRADIYALGCLLWQLLAGRPPFPTGDPLAKLAAHQTRTIEDVREWAPDTPESLADLIQRFTTREPAGRPESFREIRDRLRPARPAGAQRLARFRAEFSSAARPRDPGATRRRWMLAAGLVSAAALGSFAWTDQGIRGEVLAILPERLQSWLEADAVAVPRPSETERRNTSSSERSLPQPDANGLILLDSAGPYRLGDAAHASQLVVRGTAADRPVLILGDQPAALTAPQVVLENVVIRRSTAATDATSLPATLVISSQTLQISGCRLEDGALRPASAAATETSRSAPLVTWRPLDPQAPRGGWIAIVDTVHVGPESALRLESAAAQVEVTNCLALASAALLELHGDTPPGRGLRLRLERTTLRGGGSLVRWHVPEQRRATPSAISVEAVDCVFDLSGEPAALFQLVSRSISGRLLNGIRVTGAGNVATPPLAGATLVAPDGSGFRRLDADVIPIEGITSAPFEFAGPPTGQPADSTVRAGSISGPRLSSRIPGIDGRGLPVADLSVESMPAAGPTTN